jgi:CDP-Glycerol:Poly(glycerophosphate) glycerophosphotransferase
MIGPLIDAARRLDRTFGQRSGVRRILVDARTPVNFTMIAPIYRAMAADPRVEFSFTASEEPRRLRGIYREAPPAARLIRSATARWRRFDAYLASDFMWQPLPRGTCRIQVFHGVGGKYGFDAPTTSMRAWDRIFFVNERRLRNFIKAGAIDEGSPAVRLVGYPKADALVNGTWTREAVLGSLGLDPARSTVLYAPTWSSNSSLNAIGVDLVKALLATGVNVIVKLHDRSRDTRPFYSGGVDWPATLEPVLAGTRGVLAPGHDISPYLVAADVMVTDHSSAGFEYLLRDRPIVRIHRPELIRTANIHPDYVALLASVSQSVETGVRQIVDAVERGLGAPDALAETRRQVAADLFYRPGSATARSVRELYEAIELDPAPAVVTEEATCRP